MTTPTPPAHGQRPAFPNLLLGGVVKHGHAKRGATSKEYCAWANAVARCTNPGHPSFARYGARGITVCEKWLNSFAQFLADMGLSPSPKHTLERKNNDLGYSADNCRWATRKEQSINTRCSRGLTHNGRTMSVREWAKEIGVHHSTLQYRINRGIPIADALLAEDAAHEAAKGEGKP